MKSDKEDSKPEGRRYYIPLLDLKWKFYKKTY